MSRTLELTINAPCDWINANHRYQWYEKARRTKAWRFASYVAASTPVRQAEFDAVHIVCTVHKKRGGRWDATNLAPTGKAIVDGLVDAGVLEDDDNTRVIGPDMRAGEKRDVACVVVTVTEVTT